MKESAAPRVSAIVVHYGPFSSTERTLRSLAATAPGVPVLLVDNAGDGPSWGRSATPAGVRLLSPGRNLGYGAACNLGARESGAEFLLFLNNDVELERGAVETLAALLEKEPRVAAATHHGGVASAGVPREELDRRLQEALRLYARRQGRGGGEQRVARAMAWGARLRWALSFLMPGERGRRRRRRYADMLRLAERG